MTQQTESTYAPLKLHGLDHLRALAITLVFFFHYTIFAHPAWLDPVARFGWTGVDLFFVLSGYLISSQLFRQLSKDGTIQLKEFFIKRFFRIIPPFAVVLLLYFCFPVFREKESLPPLWKFLTFTQNFGLDLVHKGTFSHCWSLCIEEQFYFTLPFLLLFLFRKHLIRYLKYFIPAFFIIVIALRIASWYHFIVPVINTDNFFPEWYKWIYYPTYTRLDGLLTGVSIAAMTQYSERIKGFIMQKGNLFFITGLLIGILAYWVLGNEGSFSATIFGFLIVAIICGCLVASAVSASSWLYNSKSFVTTQLAGLSYSIYLSHKGIIHLTQMLLEKMGIDKTSNTTMLCCMLTCLLTGLLFRYAIEKPALKIRNMILQGQAANR